MDMLLKLDTVILENESETENETSEEICTRVIKARERQYERYQANFTNANVENEKLMPSIQLSSNQQEMMRQWTSENNWSTRVQMKVLRLARTISDLSGAEELTNEAIWEAVNLRRSQVNPQRKGAAR
jgi:magnesium chelatase family protein